MRSTFPKPNLALLALFLTPTWLLAQGIDLGRSKEDVPTQVDLLINISVDRAQNRAASGLSVQVYAPENGSMSSMAQQTDKGGRAEFHISSGVYAYKITGPGIEPYEGTLQIVRSQNRAVENVIVKSKAGEAVTSGSSGNPNSVSASGLNIPDKAVKEFRAGSKALDQKDYAEAKKRFTNATAIYGNYSLAYNGLGVSQMASGDTDSARQSFEKAVQIDDHFAEAYRNLARLSLEKHDFAATEDFTLKSLQSEPLNAWALTYAAYAELQTKKFDLAITHANAAHSVPHAGLASVHVVAAHAFEATEQLGDALKQYQIYVQEDPDGRDAARAKQAIASLSNKQPQ